MTTPAPFQLRDGAYVLDVPCPHCGATDGWSCYPGQWPECWRCGVTVLSHGRTPEAACVTPNGRIDGHGMALAAGVPDSTVRDRLRRGWTVEEALEPVVERSTTSCFCT